MNILFLLGNGFDRNLKMDTSYEAFYKNAYQVQSSDNPLIKDIKSVIEDDIQNGLKNWADLELALGKHTSKLKDREEFDIVFDDIREKLAVYISQQESPYIFDTSMRDRFLKDMRFPYNFLTAGEKNSFTQFISNFSSSLISVNAISFNYTHSLERIIDDKNKSIKIETNEKIPSFFREIAHIHGFTDNRFILGVDNIEQIANETFKTDEDILNSIIKPRLNNLAQHLCDERCKKLIDNAHIICLFGLSIGETDKTWWEYIGKRLQKGYAKLIIFWKGKEISPILADKELRAKNTIKERFLSMNPLSVKQSISQYIHIAYNSEIFKVE